MDIDDVIEQATASADKRRREDPELSKKRLMGVRTVIYAFANGVMRADTWNQNHPLPPRFESVVAWVAQEVARHFKVKEEEPLDASINEAADVALSAAHDHPMFRQWTNGTDLRAFIDAESVLQNTVYCMRMAFREVAA